MNTVIAIDGPSASGKSTAARAVAAALGFLHVDSGALYRAVCWKVTHDGISTRDAAAVRTLLTSLRLDVEICDNRMHISLNGQEPPETEMRGERVTSEVSAIAAMPEVRAFVNERLRALARRVDVVVEGRDIGTAVFPDAPHKFYITASPEERARRRKGDFETLFSKASADVEQHKAALAERDRKDSSRAADPLRMAPDAVLVDTTNNTIEQTKEQILGHIHKSRNNGRDATTL